MFSSLIIDLIESNSFSGTTIVCLGRWYMNGILKNSWKYVLGKNYCSCTKQTLLMGSWVLLFASAWFSFLASALAPKQKKTVILGYEMRARSRTHLDQWQTFPCSQRLFSSIKIVSNENGGIWYILQRKKLNSEIEERDAAKGQITFLKVILKNT